MSYELRIPSKMRIRSNKEFWISLIILIPYFDFYSIIGWMEVYFKESYLRSVVSLLLVLTVVVWLSIGIKTRFVRHRDERNAALGTLVILLVYMLVVNLFKEPDSTFFSVFMWFAIPACFAMSIYQYCKVYSLRIDKIITYSLQVFSVYLLVLIFINIVKNKLFIDMSVRMDPRGGGAVIFGYTIAFLFSLLINYKYFFSIKKYYFLMIVFTIGVIATQSRGDMWPVALLWIISFLRKKFKLWEIFLIMFVFVAAVSIDWMSILKEYLPRFLNNHDEARSINLGYLTLIFFNSDTLTKLFGYGIGKFFPYQRWIMSMMNVTAQKSNLFNSNGYSILVQPHNSFFYMLIEGGIIVVILFLLILFLLIIRKYKKVSISIINIMPFLLCLVLNNLDSIFFVEPGVAAVFWLLLFLYSDDCEKLEQ